jgi:hypothetical protein
MPYPLEAPQDAEKVLTEMLPEDTTAVLARLLDDLSDLVANWKVTAHGERRKLGATHPPHDVPMEFRAGRAEGLENAAHDVEMALAKIGR